MSIRRIIPAPVKRALKPFIEPIRNRRRRSRLKSVVDRLLAGELGSELLQEAHRAWGNEGFSADLQYLKEAVALARSTQNPILECGTGLTTLVCGAIAQRRGIAMYCLEQDELWLSEVRGLLFDLSVRTFYAPLVQRSDYAWYDINGIELPRNIGVVICDGPYVSTDWPPDVHANWRFGVLPTLKKAGITYDKLLLDDVDEPRAARVLERWAEFGATHQLIHGSDAGICAVVACPKKSPHEEAG